MQYCKECKTKPRFSEILKRYFCECKSLDRPYQPERSKREDLDDGFFPPPWNFYEHPEKTEGWIEFQKEMRKDPEYYLGCGALNTMET